MFAHVQLGGSGPEITAALYGVVLVAHCLARFPDPNDIAARRPCGASRPLAQFVINSRWTAPATRADGTRVSCLALSAAPVEAPCEAPIANGARAKDIEIRRRYAADFYASNFIVTGGTNIDRILHPFSNRGELFAPERHPIAESCT